MAINKLSDSIQYLKGVGPARAKLLNRLNIYTLQDLLYYFPRTYLDRSKLKPISQVISEWPEDEVVISGQVLTISAYRTRSGMRITEIAVADDSGIITAVWFNQPFLKRVFAKGQKILLAGKLSRYSQFDPALCGQREGELRRGYPARGYGRTPQIANAEYEIIPEHWGAFGATSDVPTDVGATYTPLHTQGIVPCYGLTEGLGQKFIRRLMKDNVPAYAPLMPDALPKPLAAGRMHLPDAIKEMHFPASMESMLPARQRLVYEELLLLQLALGLKRNRIKKSSVKYPIKISEYLDGRIRARIPFTLTKAQERVISELRTDLESPHPMHRLLQGDVGSGKTIVAIYAILAAIGNKLQTALMAPTEILAEQHFNTVSRLLAGSQVRIAFLKSGIAKTERQSALDAIKQGNIDLVVGTHALIQKDVEFSRLGLVIIDEQHKFGVIQRETLVNKTDNPHLLVMTATPIPRTLALTAFGDLDVSTIDQLPPGRQPVKTILRASQKMPESIEFIRNRIKEGRQVYFVYPIIDESDKIPAKSATQMAKQLKEIFSEYQVALLHGRKTDQHKEKIMNDFRAGKIQILVSTIVIEVGIDVPNASIMAIEHAERYGLAQLHQLRGRIGRGEHKSYCLLFGDFTTEDAESRLKIMEATNDGFRIAEEDLRIRGPGEFFGTKQSGIPEFRVADLSRDFEVLKQTRQDAQALLATDPFLQSPHNQRLLNAIKQQ
ncbi:MAG: ATP-dependent DNA helicase RecG, partial [Planctomycetota bacterium]